MKSLLKEIKGILKKARLNFYATNNIKFGSPDFKIGKASRLITDGTSKIIFTGSVTIECYVVLRAHLNASLYIGKNVFIGDYSTIRATKDTAVKIGDNTMISQGVKIISTNHAFARKDMLIRDQDTIDDKKGIIIGEDCWIGAGSVILPGITIANGVVIGANSVVTKNIPEFAIAAGNPAKILKYRQ